MSFLVHTTDARMPARAYCGMWIVDCARCQNAEQVDRFQPAAGCSYCGVRLEIIWPVEDTVHSIERLLLMRPLPYTQNWNPDETLHDLMRENAEHGVFDVLRPLSEESSGVSLLAVNDTTIKTDRLPVTRRRDFKELGT